MKTYSAKRTVSQVIANTDDSVLGGAGELDVESHLALLDDNGSVDLVLIGKILDYALQKEKTGDLDRTTTLDQWLAPRIHSALRISRRLAGDMGFWTWMVLEVGREYTWRRWKEKDRPTMYRYTGDFKRNALARLWWFAEMSRNGQDYSPIRNVLRDPSTAQYAMELRYSMYRPAVIAFGEVAAGEELGFAALKDLSKRANAYLSLRALEAIGLDNSEDGRDRDWWEDIPVAGELLSEAVIAGPRDCYASEDAIAQISEWFRSLVRERQVALAEVAAA